MASTYARPVLARDYRRSRQNTAARAIVRSAALLAQKLRQITEAKLLEPFEGSFWRRSAVFSATQLIAITTEQFVDQNLTFNPVRARTAKSRSSSRHAD
jgi:hypothetical protein